MIFENYQSVHSFGNYLETILYYKGYQPQHSKERVVPTGHVFLIFELDDIPRHTYDPLTLQANATYQKVWISGMHKNFLSISAHENSEMLVVQFKPYGAFPFFNIPIHKLNNRVIAAELVLGDKVLALRDQIQKVATLADKFKVVDEWLNQRYQAELNPEEALLKIVQQLKEDPYAAHKQIVDQYPKTQKHLIDQFKKYCGLTPKVLHRIFRFNEILQQIHQQQTIAWSDIAYQFGYSDQSHFIKEFKEFSGFNPKAFIASDYHQDATNFFPLDKKNTEG